MIREIIKYENQIIRGSIEREAEKKSFIDEFLFYITEANSELSQTSKVELFGKIVNRVMLLSLFEQSSILDVTRLWIKVRLTKCLLHIINLHSVELNTL